MPMAWSRGQDRSGASNVILGAGDPEVLQGRDPYGALLEAGAALTGLMDELAEARRKNPTDDLTSALVHAEVDGQRGRGAGAVLHPARGGRQRHHPDHDQHGDAHPRREPRSAPHLAGRRRGRIATAVDEIVQYASPVVFMRRTATDQWPSPIRRSMRATS